MSAVLADPPSVREPPARTAIQSRDDDTAGVVALLLRGVASEPNRAEAWHALGIALTRDGAPLRGLAALARAHRLAPRSLECAFHRAEAAHQAGVGDAELFHLAEESAADPLNPTLLAAAGLLLHRLGRDPEGVDAMDAACALAPDAAAPWALLGGILARSHQLPRAAAVLRHALTLDPDNADLRQDFGVVLMRLHRFAEARAELASISDGRGGSANLLCNLATATLCLGSQQQALAIALEARRLAPDNPLTHRAVVNTLPYVADVGAADLLKELRSCAAALPRPAPPAVFENQADPERRLRIGLLSGMLKTHPVGWLTIAGFEALDPARFELVGLADTMPNDALSRRFRAIAQVWRPIGALDDGALAMAARGLGIDVLIDLGGYGDMGRMSACALRLAPVQMKWVGMQNHSTGLAEMDWFITDRWESPPALAHTYSERLLRLPDGYVCYSPPSYAPAVAPLPARAAGYITFGCFTNLAKVTTRVLAAWAEILHHVADARLVIKSHALTDHVTAARVREAFAAAEIAPGRVELRGPSAHRDLLAEYGDIDIALDPFPYSGGLTTCEALWMGVPTVTLPGETFAARHSLSHLSNVGLPDWAAADAEDYIRLARAKAADLHALATTRDGMRARVRTSPLCDAPRFGIGLGAALRHAWRDWCGAR